MRYRNTIISGFCTVASFSMATIESLKGNELLRWIFIGLGVIGLFFVEMWFKDERRK